ncbi:MAG: CsgG/HfaB family protein [Acidobacteriota bacterium]
MRRARYRKCSTLILAVLLTPALAGAGGPPRMAILPLANSSIDPSASRLVTPAVAAGLREFGFEVLPAEQVEPWLRRERIRYTDSLSRTEEQGLASFLQVDYVLVGRVLSLVKKGVPEVSLTLRLLDAATGEVDWSVLTSTTGARWRRLLGLGEIHDIETLLRRAVKESLAGLRMDENGDLVAAPPPRIRPQAWAPDPIAFLDREADWSTVRTIAILPLANLSRRRGAGQILRDILVARLWATGRFKILEPGQVRQELLGRRLYPSLASGPEILRSLRQAAGIDALLTGAVLRYQEVPAGARGEEPEIEVALRLIDTDGGGILWSALHSRKGNDAVSFYDAGHIRAAPRLARALVDDLVAQFPSPGR